MRFISACILVVLTGATSALKCWTCENAHSPGECIEFGRSRLCKLSEKVCQTEIRFSGGWGKSPIIRTGCKATHACGNNFVQNPRSAWRPSQCNDGVANSVCRCCCNTNNCNENDLMCETMFGDNPVPGLGPLCSDPPTAPENGYVDCQLSKYPGSQCKFVCNQGYSLIGNNRATCTLFGDTAFWTGALPICEKQQICDPVPDPENGQVDCFGFGQVGSYCVFKCNARYEIKGTPAISCVTSPSGPVWNDDPPTCEVAKCKDVGELPHGNVTCTGDDNELGTTCSFSCGNGLILAPTDTQTTRCVWRNGRATWNRRKPCCSGVFCPPTAKKDIVIAIDSSSSISSEEWNRMKKFVINVLGKFSISPQNVEVAMYRFNKIVDTSSEISFGDHATYESLVRAIELMPKDGSGTYIGKALRHARDSVLKLNNRPNVSDMLWVLTDGKSNDKFKSVARQLRSDGVQIIALGISRKNELSFLQQLVDLTGDRELVIQVSDIFESFADDLQQIVTSKICEVNCVE